MISATAEALLPRRAGGGALNRLVLLVPAAAIFVLSFLWPLGSILLRSLNESGKSAWEWQPYWGHYVAIMQDELLRQVVLHSLMLSVVSTLLTAMLAFPAAYIVSRLSRNASSLMIVLILTPFWVSIIVRLFAFTTILGQQGIVNTSLGMVGLGPFSLLYNTFATVVGMVAYLLPYLVLILLSSMMQVDHSLLTAARTMGAPERRVFRDVYFPQVRPALLSGAVLVFVLSLGFFLTPAILGGPHNLTIPIFIEQQVQTYQWGKASAMGIALLAVSILGYLLALRIGGKDILTPMPRASRGLTAPERLRLTPVIALCWLMLVAVLILLLLPVLIVIPTAFTETTQIRFPPVGFTWKWFEEAVTSSLWQASFLKSVRVGLATAVLSTVAGLALARLGSRLRSRVGRSAIQVLSITPLIAPVILLAIGIFDVQNRLGLVGSDIGLVVAHSVLCVPLTFLVLANALAATDPMIEEAAWTMGAGPNRTFWTVVLPGIVPALIGAFAIAFMTSWDEAVIALFQTFLDKTLPVTIYSFLKSGITPVVSAVAAIVTLPVLLFALAIMLRSLIRAARPRIT